VEAGHPAACGGVTARGAHRPPVHGVEAVREEGRRDALRGSVTYRIACVGDLLAPERKSVGGLLADGAAAGTRREEP